MKEKWKKFLIVCLIPFVLILNGCGDNKQPSPLESLKYVVTFYMGADNCDPLKIPIQEITNGGKVTRPIDPRREGNSFIGWFKDPEKKVAWTFDVDTVSSNITLYAKWIEEYNIIFNLMKSGTKPAQIQSQKVKKGDKITPPRDPTLKGYIFIGWYADEMFTEKWDFDTRLNNQITLYAKWEKISKN